MRRFESPAQTQRFLDVYSDDLKRTEMGGQVEGQNTWHH